MIFKPMFWSSGSYFVNIEVRSHNILFHNLRNISIKWMQTHLDCDEDLFPWMLSLEYQILFSIFRLEIFFISFLKEMLSFVESFSIISVKLRTFRLTEIIDIDKESADIFVNKSQLFAPNYKLSFRSF